MPFLREESAEPRGAGGILPKAKVPFPEGGAASAIERPEPGAGARPARIVRAGSGDECSPSYVTWYCPKDGTVLDVRLKCEHERLCPVCSRAWAAEEARRAFHRLKVVRRWRKFREGARHVILSFPQGYVVEDGEDLRGAFADAWRLLSALGYLGGLLVYHPQRHEGAECWFSGPHFHAVIWGYQDASLEGSVVVCKVAENQPRTAEAYRRVISYMVNHAGFVPCGHAVRWFGVASYNRCPGVPLCPEDDERLSPRCPQCGGPMERAELADYTSWPPANVGVG